MGITATVVNGEVVGYVNTVVNGDTTTTILMDANAVQTGKTTSNVGTGKATSSSTTTNEDGSYVETLSDITYQVVDGALTNNAIKSTVTQTSFNSSGQKTGVVITQDGLERAYDVNGTLISEGASSTFLSSLSSLTSEALNSLPSKFVRVQAILNAFESGDNENTTINWSNSRI